jgi:hypothetical protein
MEHRTCHRRGYELLTPNIWELYDGMESKGFVKNFKNEKSGPPCYRVIGHVDLDRTDLPKDSIIRKRTLEDEFPPHLQGPEVHNILTSKEETIERLWGKVKAYEEEIGALEVEIEQLKIKLKHQKPSGSTRWKLEYTWCDNMKEVYWDFKRKKDAVAFMEDNIKGFFGIKLVESIKNVKYTKYIYGTRGVKQDEINNTQKK